MSGDSSFVHLMDRLKSGDNEAARRIFNAYAHRLIGLARTRMVGGVLQKEDPEDVVQSALASFFRRQARDPFDLTSWDSLWSLLTVITLRKCGHRSEYYRALCRDISHEAPLASDEESTGSFLAIAREPSPAEVAVLRDLLDQVLRGLDERERRIVELALENYGVAEISQMVGRSEYLVRRLLERVRTRWERLCD
jgi:RNA polymerase sigma-70 factor (ECF subfamily)